MKPSNIGGQAVMEGIMMRHKDKYSIAVRRPDKEIEVKVEDYKCIFGKARIWRKPIIRGMVSFIDSLVTGTKCLMYSAEIAGDEEDEEETRKKQIVKSALSTLSYSELDAIEHIFEELEGREGILVASKIADRVGITRSVIVNALRKFESAGVIESRSSGMKGTYIKVLNEVIFDELEEIKAQRNKKS